MRRILQIMNIIKNIWKKILYFIITGSTSVFIAACYGIPLNIKDLGPWKIRAVDSQNNPIQGLKVTIRQYSNNYPVPDTIDVATTDTIGSMYTHLQVEEQSTTVRHEAIISDIDGTENGGKFIETIVAKEAQEETIVRMIRVE
jgi:hypothetical protein